MSDQSEIFLEFEQIFRHLLRQIRKDLSHLLGDKLNGAEFGVLSHLKQKSPQIVTALAQEFEVSVSHITHVADQLEKKKLAYRKRSQLDKRVVELHITEEGSKLVTALTEQKKKYFKQKFSTLSQEEMEQLIALLKKIM